MNDRDWPLADVDDGQQLSVIANMTGWTIEIERAPAWVLTGLVRRLGHENEALIYPDLLAHRPQALRFFQLAMVIGAAKALANGRGAEAPADLRLRWH